MDCPVKEVIADHVLKSNIRSFDILIRTLIRDARKKCGGRLTVKNMAFHEDELTEYRKLVPKVKNWEELNISREDHLLDISNLFKIERSLINNFRPLEGNHLSIPICIRDIFCLANDVGSCPIVSLKANTVYDKDEKEENAGLEEDLLSIKSDWLSTIAIKYPIARWAMIVIAGFLSLHVVVKITQGVLNSFK